MLLKVLNSPGAVDAGGLNQRDLEVGLQVLLEEVHRGRRGDGGDDQRQVAVHPAQLIHEDVEAGGGDLAGDHDDAHDDGDGQLAALEVVHREAVGGQRGEVHAQHRGAEGDDGAVAEAGEQVEVLALQHLPVVQEVLGGQQAHALLDLLAGAGGVDDHDPEGDDRQEAQEDAQHVDHRALAVWTAWIGFSESHDGQQSAGQEITGFMCAV